MNKTFDLHRFGMVLRWDLLTNKKRYLFGLLGLILGFTGCFIGCLYSSRGWANAIAHGVSAPDIPSWNDFYLNQTYNVFWIFLDIVMVVMAAKVFHNMKHKLSRERFLMLPATNLEKFIARLLTMSVGAFIMVLVALVGADMIQFLFSFVITPAFHISITWPILNNWVTAFIGNINIETICAILFIHSFCTLGGSFYRKQPAVLTLVTGCILAFIFGYTITELHELGIFPLDRHMNANEIQTTICETLAIITFSLALAAFNYWASYKLFTRMQVICNKWINI